MKRCAVYTRVSSDSQAEEGATSLDDQERACLGYAKYEQMEVVGTFRDEGASGKDFARPQWKLLRAACERGEVDVVIVCKLDRFSRSAWRGGREHEELQGMGVGLALLDLKIDTSTPTGRMMFAVLLAGAQWERETITERMANGAHSMARDGRFPAGDASAPFGYKVVGEGRMRHLVVDEDEAGTIRRAVELLLDKTPLGDVVAILNSDGRLARGMVRKGGTVKRGAALWTNHTLKRRLTSETLTGHIVWGGGRNSTGKYGDPVEIPGVPEIVSAETLAAVKVALTVHAPQPERMEFPLSGKIESECGEHYTGVFRSQKGYRGYRCRGKLNVPGCKCPWYRADAVEADVIARLVKALGSEEDIRQAVEWHLAVGAGEDENSTGGDELPGITGQIGQIEKQLAGDLVAALLQAGADQGEAVAANEQLRANLTALKARKAAIEYARADRAAAVAAADRLAKVAEQMRDRLAQAGPGDLAELAGMWEVRISATGEVSCLLGTLPAASGSPGSDECTPQGFRIAA